MKLCPLSGRVLLAIILSLVATPLRADDALLQAAMKLQTPKKSVDRAEGGMDEVLLRAWVPGSAGTIRGIVVNPFNLKSVEQEHWREAARLWRFALVGANYMRVNEKDFGPTLAAALEEFSRKSGRPELRHAPLCFVGMSAGAGMSMSFARALPHRTLAVAPVCLEVGPNTPETRRIPTVTIFGEKDMRQMPLLAEKLPVERAQGALWATAVQWGRGHEFAAANNLVLPWFDQVLQRRYPPDASPAAGPVRLLDQAEAEGWLGDPATWRSPCPTVAPFTQYVGDRKSAVWFPNRYVAFVWRAFVAKAPTLAILAPSSLGDRQPFAPIRTGSPIDVTFDPGPAPLKSLELLDGDERLAMVIPAQRRVRIDPLRPGVHALILVGVSDAGQSLTSRPCTVIVSPAPAR